MSFFGNGSVGSGASVEIAITDNLMSTSASTALSAKQGKELNDKVEEHKNNENEVKHVNFVGDEQTTYLNMGLIVRIDEVI